MKNVIAMMMVMVLISGCVGALNTTVKDYDPKTGQLIKETISEDNRGSVQDRGNVVGIDLKLPDPTGLSGVPAIIQLRLGYIGNDYQATPYGAKTHQEKDYTINPFGTSTIKAQQSSESSNDKK